MDDYISRAAAISMPFANGQYDHEHANEHFIFGLETYKEWLEQVPTADVRPVVVANWYWDENGMDWGIGAWICSNCRTKAETWWATGRTNNPYRCAGGYYCGNCGADMRFADVFAPDRGCAVDAL